MYKTPILEFGQSDTNLGHLFFFKQYEISLCLKNNKDLLFLFHTTYLSCIGKALGSLVTQRTQADRVADISDVFGLSARGRRNSGISYLSVKILFPDGKSLLFSHNSLSRTSHRAVPRHMGSQVL